MTELGANGILKALSVLKCNVVKSELVHADATFPMTCPVVLRWSTAFEELHLVLPIVTDLAMLIVITILAVPTVWSAAAAMTSGASTTMVVSRNTTISCT